MRLILCTSSAFGHSALQGPFLMNPSLLAVEQHVGLQWFLCVLQKLGMAVTLLYCAWAVRRFLATLSASEYKTKPSSA